MAVGVGHCRSVGAPLLWMIIALRHAGVKGFGLPATLVRPAGLLPFPVAPSHSA